MEKNSVTITVIANITSNYSENIGNISLVQLITKNGNMFSTRTKESLKCAIMVQSGLYDDLQNEVVGDGETKVNQKLVRKHVNATSCKALEGGYLNTQTNSYKRYSSFYVTDAVSFEKFSSRLRTHNNLFAASNLAKMKNINLQENAAEAGLMLYKYQFEKDLKVFSMTIDLEMIGRDKSFENTDGYKEASREEKTKRVSALLEAVENLNLLVKGSLDNAEPVFVVGGLCERKTHYFENCVRAPKGRLLLCQDLIDKVNEGYRVGLRESGLLSNEQEIKARLKTLSIHQFFKLLKQDVEDYFRKTS